MDDIDPELFGLLNQISLESEATASLTYRTAVGRKNAQSLMNAVATIPALSFPMSPLQYESPP